MKIVINNCFGVFGLSEAAYEKLIALGIPIKVYKEQERDSTGKYLPEPDNEGEFIFERHPSDPMCALDGKYWDTWLRNNRTHPLLIQILEEMGETASGKYGSLKVVEIPDGIEWEIEENNGNEWVSEKHQTWN